MNEYLERLSRCWSITPWYFKLKVYCLCIYFAMRNKIRKAVALNEYA